MSAGTHRALTSEQMRVFLAAIGAVDEPDAMLPTLLAHVYDALLRFDGRRLADLKPAGPISPEDWQIPAMQWDAIAKAASDRAEVWGTGRQLRADLLDRMPGCYDDPAAPPAANRRRRHRARHQAGDCGCCACPCAATTATWSATPMCTRSTWNQPQSWPRCLPGLAPASPTSTRSNATSAPSCAA